MNVRDCHWFKGNTVRLASAAALLAALCAENAAGGITADEVATFLDEEASVGSWNEPRGEIIRLLQTELPQHGLDGAADAIATELRIPPAAAIAMAEAALVEELPYPRTSAENRARTRRIMQAYLEAVDKGADSTTIWNIVLDHAEYLSACETPGLAERYFASAASGTFLDPTVQCDELILTYEHQHEMTPLAWWKVRNLLIDASDPIKIAAARVFLDATLESAAPADSPEPVLYALQTYLSALADAGLSRAIVETMASLPEGQRREVVVSVPSEPVRMSGYELATSEEATNSFNYSRTEWLLALVENGQRDEARHWLAQLALPVAGPRFSSEKPAYDDRGKVFAGEGADRAEFIRRVVNGSDTEDPFDLFVGNGEAGLLWGPAQSSPIARRVAAAYMQQADYPDLEKRLLRDACRDYIGGYENLDWDQRVADLPARIQRAVEVARKLVDARSEIVAACHETLPTQPGAVARRVYREVPVPAELRTPDEQRELLDKDDPIPPEILPPRTNFVRLERHGDVIAGISLSQDVDPVGEVGGGGYWLHVSPDGGSTWNRPLYLGFQQYQPYVVTPTSRLPLLNGEMLNVEVEIQELDERSITFPPVGLRMKREARGIFLDIPLYEIERDTDGDTLTDWLEEKLRTDPGEADTDGDGIDDAWDDLPQVSARATPHRLAPILVELLHQILGFEALAVTEAVRRQGDSSMDEYLKGLSTRSSSQQVSSYLFIKGDPSYFNGILVPQATIVLTDDDLAYLRARFGVCYPLNLPDIWVNHANDRAVVEWSASWTGGTIEFRKRGQRWEAEVVSQWIT